MTFDLTGKKVFVCGHSGMVGSAVVRALKTANCVILTATRSQLDLVNQQEVKHWMDVAKPDVVILCAAKVGGILANDSFPSEFLYQNLMIESNIIHASHDIGVEKLLFLGSSCIYPKFADQPIREEALLSGALESTNEWYAIAKIAGIKLCQSYRKQYGCDFISAMPTNLYGPGDNYDLQGSHVIPALLRKCHEAKIANANFMSVWGSGEVFREFMHVDDCADGIIFLLKNYSESDHINLGVGEDITIKMLAETICEVVGFEGGLKFDSSFPSGTPRKILDVSRINKLGWKAKIGLKQGLKSTYEDYFIGATKL
jgi:GDP-L-fucose synthase|tara:strand:- start:2677 stop:3618 length:942 start_codon:yes stop_codon:yes gene_type:complete